MSLSISGSIFLTSHTEPAYHTTAWYTRGVHYRESVRMSWSKFNFLNPTRQRIRNKIHGALLKSTRLVSFILQNRPISCSYLQPFWYRFWSIGMSLIGFFSRRPGWSVGISWSLYPELWTRKHMLSAREKSLEILGHNLELNPGHGVDRQWDTLIPPLSYHEPGHGVDKQSDTFILPLSYHEQGHRQWDTFTLPLSYYNHRPWSGQAVRYTHSPTELS